LPVGVAVFARADATIHAVNSAFRAFLAAEFREFVVRGARITDVLPLAAEPALAAMLRDVEATGGAAHRDGVRFARVSAPDAQWNLDLSPLPATADHDGLLVLAVMRAAASAASSEREAELLDKVEEMQLLNDVLIGSVQQKHLFLVAMSHRLRTPLTSIVGFGEMLAAGEIADPADQRMVFGDILSAGQQMLGLIDDMIALAHLDAGGLRLRPETLDVADLIDEARESLEILAAARRQHVVVPAPETDLVAYADGRWTVQVILKLGMNSLRFSPTGGMVTLRGRDLDATHVAIDVEDSGVGIRAEEQSAVFQAFAVTADGQEKSGGTGLELALAKRLVELQGGTITFASVRGVGTTFTVTLPKPGAGLAPSGH
ncbi:MAG: HAMP domain-containing histidine kinase, partial [Chloroflexota bacterium]|nr:HAMP domain-containing histidine kinase [Chloroflexota bacterium]